MVKGNPNKGKSPGKKGKAKPGGGLPTGVAGDGPSIGQQTSHIKNKQRRTDLYGKLKKKKKDEKVKEREKRAKVAAEAIELGQLPPPKQIPRTIENTREKDVTMVEPGDEEVLADEAQDEFADYFNGLQSPKVLLTTSQKPSAIMFRLLEDLLKLIPNAWYYKRGTYEVKQITKYAANNEFSHVVVINENRKTINGLLVIFLPDGPTAHFRLSNLVISKKIKGHGNPTKHRPELILNNFSTRLGHRVGRLLATMWPIDPQFRGRRVVTFHNQRDFVFFRHHRYIFESREDGKGAKEHKGHLAKPDDAPRLPKDQKRKLKKKLEKEKKPEAETKVQARLQELGPRFTLRLLSLQRGTFDSKGGEYEWVKASGTQPTRKRFAL
ncbi:Ribosome production factor 1 [Cymbomonas tetramitiformis]|uniref:Ribosome production factor 1 n=1 Tax=Cymbomonas tetramitiformis TaxID=36881 RepID=A0AAE0GWI9_9CHLO|nr:Ribosome production factor 1 [Cymbomonas tetramitiformis]